MSAQPVEHVTRPTPWADEQKIGRSLAILETARTMAMSLPIRKGSEVRATMAMVGVVTIGLQGGWIQLFERRYRDMIRDETDQVIRAEPRAKYDVNIAAAPFMFWSSNPDLMAHSLIELAACVRPPKQERRPARGPR